MQVEIKGHVIADGDCGHKIKVPITRLEDEFTCPECGRADRFNTDQVAGLKAQLNAKAADFGVDKIREALGESMRKAATGSKHVTYKPGGRNR